MDFKDHIFFENFIVRYKLTDQVVGPEIVYSHYEFHGRLFVGFSQLKKNSHFHVVMILRIRFVLGILYGLFYVFRILLRDKHRRYFYSIQDLFGSFNRKYSMHIFLVVVRNQDEACSHSLCIQNFLTEIAAISVDHNYERSIIFIPRKWLNLRTSIIGICLENSPINCVPIRDISKIHNRVWNLSILIETFKLFWLPYMDFVID